MLARYGADPWMALAALLEMAAEDIWVRDPRVHEALPALDPEAALHGDCGEWPRWVGTGHSHRIFARAKRLFCRRRHRGAGCLPRFLHRTVVRFAAWQPIFQILEG